MAVVGGITMTDTGGTAEGAEGVAGAGAEGVEEAGAEDLTTGGGGAAARLSVEALTASAIISGVKAEEVSPQRAGSSSVALQVAVAAGKGSRL